MGLPAGWQGGSQPAVSGEANVRALKHAHRDHYRRGNRWQVWALRFRGGVPG
jgi:hypothetical protein